MRSKMVLLVLVFNMSRIKSIISHLCHFMNESKGIIATQTDGGLKSHWIGVAVQFKRMIQNFHLRVKGQWPPAVMQPNKEVKGYLGAKESFCDGLCTWEAVGESLGNSFYQRDIQIKRLHSPKLDGEAGKRFTIATH